MKKIETKLHDGEPYFILRAQDKFAPAAIQSYAAISNHHKSCHQIIERFIKWQKENQQLVKTPD